MSKQAKGKKMIGGLLKLVSGKSDLAKGAFGAIFPKAGNTKVGRFFQGIVNGGAQATPLTFTPFQKRVLHYNSSFCFCFG